MSGSDDRLLKDLGARARELHAAPPKAWQQYLDGELDEAGIEALAAAEPERFAMVSPLDDDFVDRTLSTLPERGGRRRRPRWWMALPMAAAAAVAAAIMLFARPAALPTYTVELKAGDALWRGGSAAPATLVTSSTVSLVLRPDKAVDPPVEVRAFAVQEGRAQRLLLPPAAAESGAFSLRAPIADLVKGRGRMRLVFVLGRPGDLPADVSGIASGRAPAPEGVQVLEAQVEVTP